MVAPHSTAALRSTRADTSLFRVSSENAPGLRSKRYLKITRSVGLNEIPGVTHHFVHTRRSHDDHTREWFSIGEP